MSENENQVVNCPCGLPMVTDGLVYSCPQMHVIKACNPIERLPRETLAGFLKSKIEALEAKRICGAPILEIILSEDYPWGHELYMRALPLYRELLMYKGALEAVEECQAASQKGV